MCKKWVLTRLEEHLESVFVAFEERKVLSGSGLSLLVGRIVSPLPHAEIPPPSTSERGSIWRQGLCRRN